MVSGIIKVGEGGREGCRRYMGKHILCYTSLAYEYAYYVIVLQFIKAIRSEAIWKREIDR
jgi:hypothetical protein